MSVAIPGVMRGKKLGEIFVDLGVLDADQEKAALEFSAKWGVPFGRACVRMGFMDEQTVVQALSMQMGVPSVSIRSIEVPLEVVKLLSAEFCEKHRVVPVSVVAAGGRRTLVIAMGSTKNLALVDEIGFRTGCRVSAVLAADSEIEAALLKYYGIDVDRRSKASNMVELEEGADGLEMGGEVIHDHQRLAMDFLPTVEIK